MTPPGSATGPSPAEAWPGGLGPLVDHVTGRSMEFGLWFEPEMVNEDSDVARAHPEWVIGPLPRPDPAGVPPPAGAEPVDPRGLRPRARADGCGAGRVRHRLHQVGPQPRSARSRHPRHRPRRRPRPDPRHLPADGRAEGRPPRARDRVLLLRWAPAWTSRCSSAPTGCGSRTASTPWTRQPDEPLDLAARPARAHGQPHRLGPLPHHGAPAHPRLPRRERPVRPPRHRMGPHAGERGGDRRAALLDHPLPRTAATCCSPATWCAPIAATARCGCTASSPRSATVPCSPSPPSAAPTVRSTTGSDSPGSTPRPSTACCPLATSARTSSLTPPRWMQLAQESAEDGGLLLPGSALMVSGLATPLLDPEQALLIDITRAEAS